MRTIRYFLALPLLLALLFCPMSASAAAKDMRLAQKNAASGGQVLAAAEPAQADCSQRVLFIGNSFTYYNRMPQMLQAMAASRRQQVLVGSLLKGGATLSGYVADRQTLQQVIAAQKWTHVILQDQSLLPAVSPQNTLQASKQICAMLPQDAQKVFFLTWAYRDAKSGLQPGMQQALSETYVQAAKQNNAAIAPVGPAFAACMQQQRKPDLYVEDGRHPSVAGSYLSACVLYAKIFKQTPVGLPAELLWDNRPICRLEPAQALSLQQQAWRSVEQFSDKQVLEVLAAKKKYIADLQLHAKLTLEQLVALYGQAQGGNKKGAAYQFKLPHQLSLLANFSADGKHLQSAMLLDAFSGIQREWNFREGS